MPSPPPYVHMTCISVSDLLSSESNDLPQRSLIDPPLPLPGPVWIAGACFRTRLRWFCTSFCHDPICAVSAGSILRRIRSVNSFFLRTEDLWSVGSQQSAIYTLKSVAGGQRLTDPPTYGPMDLWTYGPMDRLTHRPTDPLTTKPRPPSRQWRHEGLESGDEDL